MEQLGITVFDVAVIAIGVFGAALGMSAGFAHAVLFLASWAGAGWMAVRFSAVIQPEVQQLVQSAELAYFVSMLVVFVAALIVLVMLTNALSRSIRASPLRNPDRILGAGFGVLVTWIALGFFWILYENLGPKPMPGVVEGGATKPAIQEMASFIGPYLPSGFRERLKSHPSTSTDTGSGSTPAPAPTTDDPASPATPKQQ